jgi:RND family efflux transporter MFP subunit
MRHRTPLLLPTALALGALLACGGSKRKDASEKPRGVPVRTATVIQRDLDESLVLTGTLRPRAQVPVVAEVAARLLRVVKDEGASVAAGDLLAVLDDTDYRLAFDRANAALAVAEANRAHATAEKERAESLLKTGGITDKDRLTADVALQVAEASLAQARAEAAIAAQQHARTQVKAPFGGRVAKRFVDAGVMLANGTPLFTLVDDGILEFRATVPSANWAKVKVGASVDVTVDALPGVSIAGRVTRVAPLVEERTRAFEAVVEMPGRKDLVGGLFARATVRVGTVKGALVVPPAALVRDGDGKTAQAFVVLSGKAERRKVGVGVEGAELVQVADGLAAGDVVVVDPPTALGSGSPVEIQNGRTTTN